MQAQELKECPLCHSKNVTIRYTCEDFTSTHEKFQLSECQDCTFIFTTPQPTENTIGKYYESPEYISHSESNRSLFDKAYTLARKQALNWKRKLVEANQPRNRKLLDVGCGTGNFLQHMNSHGWDTTGVEPSESAAAKARDKNAGKIFIGIDGIGNQKFDVITLWHVLEHLHEPKKKLLSLRDLLEENGTIIIAVPNRESFDAKYYKNYWAAYDVPRHLWHFSPANMKSILEQTGFRLTAQHPMLLDSFYVSLLSESYQNKNRNKIVNLFSAFWVGLLSNLKATKSKNYSSLIYVAKK